MPKKHLEVVELQLGIDTDKLSTKPVLFGATQVKIDQFKDTKIEETISDSAAKELIKIEEQTTHQLITTCFNKLLEAGGTGVDSIEISGICGGKSMLSIMVRLNNLIKKRGGLWKVTKKKSNGKTIYYLKTT